MKHTVLDGEKGLTWVDVVDPSPSELTNIAHTYGLHPTSVRDCLDPEHLPKYEQFPDRAFLIIRVFDVESAADCATVQEMTRKVAMFFGDNLLVTIHRKPLPFLTEMMHTCRTEAEAGTVQQAVHVVLDIVDKGLDTYEPPLEKIESGLDDIETALFESRHDADDLLALYVIRRRTVLIRRMLWRSIETLKQLTSPADTGSPHFQDVRETTDALLFYADQQVESATNLTNLQLALASQKTNQVVRLLTIFSAFFLPLTFIVGVYGMNFDFMPELRHRWGYPGVLVFMALVTLSIWLWFRRKGWLTR